MRQLWLLALLLLTLGGCSDGSSNGTNGNGGEETPLDIAPLTTGVWYRPPPLVSWQWQLQGELNSGYNVDLYDIDLFDTAAELIHQLQRDGHRVICYFSAGSYEAWRSDAELFNTTELGNQLDGWEGERWLDIRADNVLTIMESRLDLAVEKGCDGVEPDNVDGYQNDTGFPLSATDQLNFNRRIANAAHERGLAVGLKNDLDQVEALLDYFDFALNEQCFEYDECALLTPFIDADKAVLNAEYQSRYVDVPVVRATLCSESLARQFSTLVLPLELDDAFRYSCL